MKKEVEDYIKKKAVQGAWLLLFAQMSFIIIGLKRPMFVPMFLCVFVQSILCKGLWVFKEKHLPIMHLSKSVVYLTIIRLGVFFLFIGMVLVDFTGFKNSKLMLDSYLLSFDYTFYLFCSLVISMLVIDIKSLWFLLIIKEEQHKKRRKLGNKVQEADLPQSE